MQKLEKEKGFMKEMHDADGQKITFLNMVQRKIIQMHSPNC